jgi:hypothetical protein
VYGRRFDPKETTMIAEGILLIRRSCPFDRTPVPAIPKVERLT